MGRVSIERRGTTGILWLENPPVNAIDYGIRSGLLEALKQLAQDQSLTAGIIIGRSKTFPAGSDVREFGLPIRPPLVPAVALALEACDKPLIAAIHGQALGGGFELALACHYRMLSSSARVGLPEVTLGIIPGAGGTQRLPRLVGLAPALDIITAGKAVAAAKALELGLVDCLSEQDLLEDALAFAIAVAGKDVGPRRLSERSMPRPENLQNLLAGARERVARWSRGQAAPVAAIDVIAATLDLPFAEAMALERRQFDELRTSDQAIAMRHIFFAERACTKVPGVTDVAQSLPIERVGVVGGGTMGCGIALAALAAGYSVILVEQSIDAAAAAQQRIEKSLDDFVARGKLAAEDRDCREAAFSTASYLSALADVDLVVEAVFEDMSTKVELMQQLGQITRRDTILASNTSYLNLDELAAASGRADRVVGLHFFAPANVMKLLEIVRAADTAPEVIATAFAFAKRLGKVGVMSGVCHGFIANRMYQCYQREVGLLLVEGATPSQIDEALTDWGMAMGPCSVADMSGLDIGYAMRRSLDPARYEADAFRIHDRLVENNHKGRKTDAGFYLYEGSEQRENPLALEIIEAVRDDLGVTRRTINDSEIVERSIYALVVEGARILDEGIAQRASDIDVVYVNGYGFPRWRGGPMQYAKTVGLDTIRKKVVNFAEGRPRWWSMPPELDSAATCGDWGGQEVSSA
ncbi:MAG: 3-hydroxyacyl-CoA dehydrogenase [Halieaceae bacterium]|jgi:3-hydroxyacyl-CoA dehydrogenase